jgi:predicted site-specific integrase-resolvase
MNPKPNARLIAAFDDLIKEEDLIKKLGSSRTQLYKLRKAGVIKYYHKLSGIRVYSKTEIAQLLGIGTNKIDRRLIESFNDIVNEQKVKDMTGLSRITLSKLRLSGQLKWYTITGRNILYSKTDIVKALHKHLDISKVE